MIVGRILAWIFIVAAIAALGVEVVRYFQTGAYRVLPTGQLWFDLGPNGLTFVQSALRRHVHPLAWDAGVAPLLQVPAWAVFGVPGILLAWLCRGRHERREAAAPS